MNIIDFLLQLDINLNNSINIFQSTPKNKVSDLSLLYSIIQKNITNLHNYIDFLKQLEQVHFSNLFDNNQQFLLNIDNNDANNMLKKFKSDIAIEVNAHKLKQYKKNMKKLQKIHKIDVGMLDTCNISNNKINIPVISDIKDIPPMFYWYDGDKTYKRGIYTCISDGFYIKVPFPNVVSITDPKYKISSVPCRYETREQCDIQKKKTSELHNSDIRICTFVHKNEKITKLGSIYRCSKEDFGNHKTLEEDLKIVKPSDIKRILMYSLSDSLLSAVWYQNKFKDSEIILSNI